MIVDTQVAPLALDDNPDLLKEFATNTGVYPISQSAYGEDLNVNFFSDWNNDFAQNATSISLPLDNQSKTNDLDSTDDLRELFSVQDLGVETSSATLPTQTSPTDGSPPSLPNGGGSPGIYVGEEIHDITGSIVLVPDPPTSTPPTTPPSSNSSISLDVDGNNNVDALTDGVLILRYLFGFQGDALIGGAVASDASRTTAADIESLLETSGSLFDVDGNNNVDALTDGVLILRYLFGFEGDTLISGAVADDASRITADEIQAYMEEMMFTSSTNQFG